MFTGIISGMGRIEAIDATPETDSVILRISAPNHTENLDLGGSIAVNGVCLTATTIAGDTLSLDVMGETLRHTTIGALAPGEGINLERCVQAGGRLDGHVVQGHVDGVGHLVEHESLGAWDRFRFAIPFELARYVAEEGVHRHRRDLPDRHRGLGRPAKKSSGSRSGSFPRRCAKPPWANACPVPRSTWKSTSWPSTPNAWHHSTTSKAAHHEHRFHSPGLH